MAFYNDQGEADYGFDVSWLDDILADDVGVPEYQYQRPEEQFSFSAQPAPADQPAPYIPTSELPYRFQPQDEMVNPGSTYVPERFSEQPAEQQVNPVTGAITRAAGNLGKWAVENPRDVLGGAIGAGMGIFGLLQDKGEVPKPDTAELQRARQALEAQAAKGSRVNDPVYEAAMRNIQAQLDQPKGHDPRLVQQRADERAEKEAYYQGRGTLNSDIAKRDLARFDAETTSLLERDAATRGGQLMEQYRGAASTANPEQQTRTFSQLANLGIQGAQLEQQGAQTNAQLQEARRNQLLKTGGDIFGRSISTDPFEEERKRKAAQAAGKTGSAWG